MCKGEEKIVKPCHQCTSYDMVSHTAGSEVIKLFSCSTVLSIFKLLINIVMAKINGNFRFKSPKPVIYPANKCNKAF